MIDRDAVEAALTHYETWKVKAAQGDSTFDPMAAAARAWLEGPTITNEMVRQFAFDILHVAYADERCDPDDHEELSIMADNWLEHWKRTVAALTKENTR
jgi:hypothetical protein